MSRRGLKRTGTGALAILALMLGGCSLWPWQSASPVADGTDAPPQPLSPAQPRPWNDAHVRQVLPGFWVGAEKIEGERWMWIVEHRADGSFDAEFDVTAPDGARRHWSEGGTWRVRQGRYHMHVHRMDRDQTEHRREFQLLEVRDFVITYQSPVTGIIYVIERIHPGLLPAPLDARSEEARAP